MSYPYLLELEVMFFGNWLIFGGVFALIPCSFPNALKVVGLALFLFCVMILVLFPGGRFAIFGIVFTFPIPVLLLLVLFCAPPAFV